MRWLSPHVRYGIRIASITWHMNRFLNFFEQMNKHYEKRPRPQTAQTALYEVVYVTLSQHRAAVLPKPSAEIAYVRHLGLDKRYLVPHAGRWTEVNEETAMQRAEGLRRARPS